MNTPDPTSYHTPAQPRAPRRRSALRQRRRTAPGAAPGTLIADPLAQAPVIRFIGYGPDDIEERQIVNAEDASGLVGKWPVSWINVDGLGDADVIRTLGECFGVHRLALEDILDVHQRPKVEEYSDHVFIITRMTLGADTSATEQMTMFLGDGYVLTFQERPGDCFDPVRERLRRGRGEVRKAKADYLSYTLLDSIIDAYFPVLEAHGERLESIERAVVEDPGSIRIGDIHGIKRDLLAVRRAIWPQREMLTAMIRDPSPWIGEQTRVYLRDCYDHAIQLLDLVETYREIASSLVDIYLSSQTTRLNEVMKVLTVIATIFMPLSFIASLYGMNFDREAPWNMPELGWRYGYVFSLIIMAIVGFGLFGYFWRRGWIGNKPRRRRVERRRSADVR